MAESNLPIIVIVGSETLLGRELREVSSERHLDAQLQLAGVAPDTGLITEEEGEAAVIAPLSEAIWLARPWRCSPDRPPPAARPRAWPVNRKRLWRWST